MCAVGANGRVVVTRDGKRWATSTVGDGDFHAVWGHESTLFAGGPLGIVRSDDHGDSWFAAHDTDGAPLALRAIAGTSADRAFALDNTGVVLPLGGGAPRRASYPKRAHRQLDLRGLAVTPTCLVAVGAGATLLRSTDDGTSWTAPPVPLDEAIDVNAVFSTPEAIVAVTSVGGVVLRSTDDGATWHAVPTAGRGRLDTVWGEGATWWVAGPRGTLQRSDDVGASWNNVDLGASDDARHLCGAAGRVWMLGTRWVWRTR